MSSAIMIGPLLDSVTGLTSRPSSLKKPAPRATAVGSPVFQLGETRATVIAWSSAAPEERQARPISVIRIRQKNFFMNGRAAAIIEGLPTRWQGAEAGVRAGCHRHFEPRRMDAPRR